MIRDECRAFHFQGLRHHGATMALNACFTAEIVIAIGGWKSGQMMRRYLRLPISPSSCCREDPEAVRRPR